jgi:hypothetical protein
MERLILIESLISLHSLTGAFNVIRFGLSFWPKCVVKVTKEFDGLSRFRLPLKVCRLITSQSSIFNDGTRTFLCFITAGSAIQNT